MGLSFSDVDECNASLPVCDVNANCQNTRGSYRCSCKAGFTGDGKTCIGKVAEYLSARYLVNYTLIVFLQGKGGGGGSHRGYHGPAWMWCNKRQLMSV